MFEEFKKFVLRGNVLDLAVALIIGAAFGKIVTSLVNDIILPPIGLLFGGVDFDSLFINLTSTPYTSLAEAQAAGAATINYGVFLSTILDFLIVAFVVFLMVRQINRLTTKPTTAPEPVPTRECPACLSTIPLMAHRCAFCTTDLTAA